MNPGEAIGRASLVCSLIHDVADDLDGLVLRYYSWTCDDPVVGKEPMDCTLLAAIEPWSWTVPVAPSCVRFVQSHGLLATKSASCSWILNNDGLYCIAFSTRLGSVPTAAR